MNKWRDRPVIEPTQERGDQYSHPAWGQITLHAIQGGGIELYGSDFAHSSCVEIKIHRSLMERNLSHDWPYQKEELIAVRMSHAQWATFVSSVGRGSGTLCTIDHVGGDPTPRFPLRDTQKEFDQEGREAIKLTTQILRDLRTGLENGELSGLSKAKQAAVLDKLSKAEMEISKNLPFISKSFGEHMEKTVEKAKVEVHAYVNNAIQRAGLDAIAAGPAPLQIADQGEDFA